MIVYKATNKINNKVYIGITTKTLEHRKRIHIRDSKTKDTYFYRALRKYSENNFEWEIIDSAETMEELEELKHIILNSQTNDLQINKVVTYSNYACLSLVVKEYDIFCNELIKQILYEFTKY